ncbi:MAG: type VI secretion system baseplate subunit TssE [Betaproteobacteria bacterium HGW-Betaproteobacteria-13]|nr:MAG: type VI secretion system baseplate subunit TssE [Betaproteobacteria bacterium HGW-Betaproteobacteria-21]PKO81441.1 MAG: type VI secretion system baseplate subunit TssE [Betaproteobacteria bacterium HGW-Betaproteobacteria-13]
MTGFEPSLHEKLFGAAGDPSPRQGLSLDRLKASVARDLESLLNTRIGIPGSAFSAFPEARRSVIHYGLSDFSSLSLSSLGDRVSILQALRSAIVLNEPRLRNVDVAFDSDRKSENRLLFTVRALLVVRPLCEAVSFDLMLKPTTQQYLVGSDSMACAGV